MRLCLRAVDGSHEDVVRYVKRSLILPEDAPIEPSARA